MRAGQRLRRVEGAGELVVLAGEGGVVAAPHLPADEDRLLEALEPLGHRREEQAEAGRLLGVPGGADAEDRAPARQHVERGHRLREQARLAVDDRGDHGQQLDPLGLGGQEAERGVGLEHLVLGRADVADLPDVVHDADPVDAAVVGALGDVTELGAELGGPAFPGEVRDVQTQFHISTLSPPPDCAANGRYGRRQRAVRYRHEFELLPCTPEAGQPPRPVTSLGREERGR